MALYSGLLIERVGFVRNALNLLLDHWGVCECARFVWWDRHMFCVEMARRRAFCLPLSDTRLGTALRIRGREWGWAHLHLARRGTVYRGQTLAWHVLGSLAACPQFGAMRVSMNRRSHTPRFL